MQRPELGLSGSVSKVLSAASADEETSAGELAAIVFRLHPEYADKLASSVSLKATENKRHAEKWIADVKNLFDLEKIQVLGLGDSMMSSSQPPLPELHGRLLVIGLSLLDEELCRQLDDAGVSDALLEELNEPLEEILTEHGKLLYDQRKITPAETVVTWDDDPLQDPDLDLLGRNAFARYLSGRISTISPDSGAYAIHIFGPWGAGKSTLLQFMKTHLEGEGNKDQNGYSARAQHDSSQDWLVVDYNAWRHQHIQPPWWSLMDKVYVTCFNELSFADRMRERWWRLNTGQLHYVIGLVFLIWSVALIAIFFQYTFEHQFLDVIATITEITALVVTVWGGMFAADRSLLLGSARAAKRYQDVTRNPTNAIRDRFAKLIERIPKRVAIFVDDLDRCQSQYVVDLLEGIQTLFRDAPVVFVVAADRQWLNACYEDVYVKLKQRIHEPGKPLGVLFLEKAFRFCTPMPGIPDELKASFWNHLLSLKSDEWKTQMEQAYESAKRTVDSAQDKDAVTLMKETEDRSFPERRAIREEFVVRSATPEVIERLEHALRPYLHLLEPNPRSMKLLVNGYSANRALASLSEQDIDGHQLALWTILVARWPQLADYVLENCEMLEKSQLLQNLQNGDYSKLPDELGRLFDAPSIRQVGEVIKGGDLGGPLTVETIRNCTKMQA